MSGRDAGRRRAERLDPETRRGLIVDAAESLLAEHDPLLLTFDEVARSAGVSRPLVHNYLGDRRGLLDAVQVRIIGRLDTRVAERVGRATTPTGYLRELIAALLGFVDQETEAWGVLMASGGLDHPVLHRLRARWVEAMVAGTESRRTGAQVAVAALLADAGAWTARGVDRSVLERTLIPLLDDRPAEDPARRRPSR